MSMARLWPASRCLTRYGTFARSRSTRTSRQSRRCTQTADIERFGHRAHSCSSTTSLWRRPRRQRVLRTILDQARQGDEEAFAALVRAVGDRSIYIAHRILRDASLAEDAVQAALITVWREL